MSDMLEHIAKILARHDRRTNWGVNDMEDAPEALIDLIECAMIDFGPNGHCEGADEIADIVWDDWIKKLTTDASAQNH